MKQSYTSRVRYCVVFVAFGVGCVCHMSPNTHEELAYISNEIASCEDYAIKPDTAALARMCLSNAVMRKIAAGVSQTNWWPTQQRHSLIPQWSIRLTGGVSSNGAIELLLYGPDDIVSTQLMVSFSSPELCNRALYEFAVSIVSDAMCAISNNNDDGAEGIIAEGFACGSFLCSESDIVLQMQSRTEERVSGTPGWYEPLTNMTTRERVCWFTNAFAKAKWDSSKYGFVFEGYQDLSEVCHTNGDVRVENGVIICDPPDGIRVEWESPIRPFGEPSKNPERLQRARQANQEH